MLLKIENGQNMDRIYKPDETDIEFRTAVIPMELISESGDHILTFLLFRFVETSGVKSNLFNFGIYFVSSYTQCKCYGMQKSKKEKKNKQKN